MLRRSDVKSLVTNGHGETHNNYFCLFRAVAVHFYESAELETNAAKFFSDFLHESGNDAINFRGVSMDHPVFVENVLKHNIFIDDIDIEGGNFVGELAGSIIEMYENSINLLLYTNHICYVDNINTFFKGFRCPNCDTFIKHSSNFNRHVKSYKDRIQHFYPKNVYLTKLELAIRKIKKFSKTFCDLTI